MRSNSFTSISVLSAALALAAGPAWSADTGVTDQLVQTRKNVTILHLKMEEANALAELNALQSLATPQDWARHEAEQEAKKQSTAAQQSLSPYGMPAPSGFGAPASQPATAAVKAPAVSVMPEVVAVFGTGKALYAAIRYPSGAAADVRVGDHLETGHTVTRISANQVSVKKGSKTQVLGSYSGRSARSVQAVNPVANAPIRLHGPGVVPIPSPAPLGAPSMPPPSSLPAQVGPSPNNLNAEPGSSAAELF